MKIAVPFEDGNIFQHFGHTARFKLYDTADGFVEKTAVVDTNGSGHGALAGFLRDHGVTHLICGGIGAGAKNALAEADITVYGGVTGSCNDAVCALLAGTLKHNPNAACAGHDHGGGKEHSCAHHGSCGGSASQD
ncbi:MAG: NifB/NifX family molybdenum-iron cluster-binding protein [Bacteroides sp.]|nr:NifB/NifX family molybdenum-iron cluster-binding protein [Prevotella sp.]MCM1407169.1 NifB/NifX family molybdenum-iron cluster-binding protein [Treponema brennaborense]MCM1470321.1 NifB/NifX family molybdenum-iron cluster-binding protein [Bacteroides sp.]